MTINMTKKQLQQALDQAEQIIRANKSTQSKQPRFDINGKNTTQMFYSILNWAKEIIFTEPRYMLDSRKRDEWLAKIVLKEPYLLGILHSVVSIDKNRGYTMVGGRNQVGRFLNVSHNFQVAPDVYGWRPGQSVTAQSYYQYDLGGVVETGRSQKNGVLAAMYTVDSTKCKLTGKIDTPLYYQNSSKAENKGYWNEYDYFRVVSFPNPNEAMSGLGYCAISRCVELAKLLVSVFEHDRERLGSKAPKGILTINGVTQQQWLQSLEESDAERSELEQAYYNGVQVLAGDSLSPVTVALTSLSNLPEQFDHKQFMDMIMGGYALAFGYDPREFWSMSEGSLGSGNETKTQHRKATSKGGMDYALNFQEQFQAELPDTLQFEFEERDVDGDIAETAFEQSQLNIITQMFTQSNSKGETQITREEARQLLVEADLIPDTWTTYEEDIESTDTNDGNTEDAALLEKQRVRLAIEKYPDEDIVRYSSNTNKVHVIRRAGAGRFQMRVKKPKVLAKNKKVTITEADVEAAMKEAKKRLGDKAVKVINA